MLILAAGSLAIEVYAFISREIEKLNVASVQTI
jgi:hypothetical protein